eukprot:TRINITY_DN5801_c0_g2_i4.p1 TRINITY_DN5801_c0_g2~~TRINITY_DN5801_c0_g2_i4.p1  ORF type:complete len:125 (+),score=14.22 TRINITY_DN5801_c0_g2_i4:191-565(+)
MTTRDKDLQRGFLWEINQVPKLQNPVSLDGNQSIPSGLLQGQNLVGEVVDLKNEFTKSKVLKKIERIRTPDLLPPRSIWLSFLKRGWSPRDRLTPGGFLSNRSFMKHQFLRLVTLTRQKLIFLW